MAKYFSDKTFQYFESAQKNKNYKKWFENNRELYLEHVREPFSIIIESIAKEFRADLPRIDLNPQAICRPIRPANRAAEGGGLIKNFSHVTLWEKKTSLFEWNPGIHIQFGAGKEDNYVGLGLYMVSSRQMSLLRNNLVQDFEEIDALLSQRSLKKVWGEVLGEKFKRFPKGYNAEDPRAKYLWNKQFYIGQHLTRSEVKNKNLARRIVSDLDLAMPFFKWVRNTVGTYKSNKRSS